MTEGRRAPRLETGWCLAAAALLGGVVPAWGADLRLGHGYYSREEYRLAAQEYEGFLATKPAGKPADEAGFFLAESYLQLREEEKALPIYERLAAPAKGGGEYHRMSLFRLGERRHQRGEHARAVSHLGQFVREYPADALAAHAGYLLGESRLAEGQLKEAEEAFRQAAQAKPAPALATSIRFGQAKLAERLGQWDQARAGYESVAGEQGDLADDAQFALGVVHFQQQKFPEALAAFERFEARFPKSPLLPSSRLNQGLCHYQAGQYDRAISMLAPLTTSREAPVAIAPQAWYWLGLAHLKKEDYPRATATLREGAGRYPDSPNVADMLFHAAYGEYQAGQWAAARASFEKFAQGHRDYKDLDRAWYYVGRAALSLGDGPGVLAAYRNLEKGHPASPWRGRAAVTVAEAVVGGIKLGGPAPPLAELAKQTSDEPSRQRLQYFHAAHLFSQSQYPATAQTLLALLKEPNLDPSLKPEAQYLLGMAQAKAEQWSEAIAPLWEFLAASPKAALVPTAIRALGEALAQVEETPPLRARIDELVELAARQGDAALLESLAEQQYRAKRYALAGRIYERMRDASPESAVKARAHLGVGWCLHELGRHDTAHGQFLAAARLESSEPGLEPGLQAEAHFMAGVNAEKLGKSEEALVAYHKVFRDFTKSEYEFEAGQRIADLVSRNGQLDLADSVYEEMARRSKGSPRLAKVLVDRAWLAWQRGKADLAEQLFEQCVRERPQAPEANEALLKLAEIRYEQGRLDESIGYTRQLEGRRPGPDLVAGLLYRRGMAARQQGKGAEAQSAFRELTTASPDHALAAAASFWLGEIAFDAGKTDEAIAAFERVLARKDGEKYHPIATLRLAQSHLAAKRWDEAYAQAQRILAAGGEELVVDEAMYVQGRALQQRADFDAARERYGRILRGQPTELAAKAQFMLAETFFHQRRFEDAKREFLKVEILYKFPQWQSMALLELGKCYEQLGDPDKAQETFARLIERFPESEAAAQAKDRKAGSKTESAKG